MMNKMEKINPLEVVSLLKHMKQCEFCAKKFKEIADCWKGNK